jgi:hypothetical protein
MLRLTGFVMRVLPLLKRAGCNLLSLVQPLTKFNPILPFRPARVR